MNKALQYLTPGLLMLIAALLAMILRRMPPTAGEMRAAKGSAEQAALDARAVLVEVNNTVDVDGRVKLNTEGGSVPVSIKDPRPLPVVEEKVR